MLALGGGAAAQERAPANIWTVTTADDPGPDACGDICSLRAAINAANESEGGGEIRFAIVGSTTITPSAQLPPLRGAEITLDGRTQPGWSAAAPPLVYLDGRRAGDAAGIVIYGPNAAVRGLAIGGFQRYGIGVIGAGARDAVVQDNWLGMTPDGRGAAANRLSGVAVLAGASDARVTGNRIAGNSTDNSADNSAGGRTGHGVVVGGAGARGAQVTENIIGLNADGLPLPNDDGVLVVDGAQAVVRGNVICASRVAGVEFRDTRAGGAIDGNRIGVAGDGRAAANDVGVFLGGGVAEVSVGARGRNIIAANRVGIAVEQGARAVLLQDNWIGLVPAPNSDALADALPAPNAERGISIIAGASQVRVVANQVLAGQRGIVIAGQGTAQVSLHRNTIGGAIGATDATVAGIEAREASDVRIGGDRGLGNAVQGAASAILLADIAEVDISYNRIGAEFAELGFASASETGVGIALTEGARSARVGENRIGGIAGAAVELSGAGTRDNLITRNVFGTVGGEAIAIGAAVSAPAPPTLQSYAVERRSPNRLRSTIRGSGEPGTAVEVYELGADRIGYVARAEVGEDGTFEATSLLAPQGEIRAVAISRRGTGQTSQFSASMSTPDRQEIGDIDKLQWIAIEGVERSVGEALAALEPSLEAAWRWDAGAGRWLAWSPRVPAALSTLRTVRGGDVLALRLLEGAPREYFSTESAGGPPASALLRAGQNLVSWSGPWVDAIAALERLNAAQPGLLSVVEQWDGERWQVIWPRLSGAWDPGKWGAPALRVRATSDALWVQGG